MRQFKYVFVSLATLVFLLFSILPLSNIVPGLVANETGVFTLDRMFSTDRFEGYLNLFLLKFGISGNAESVVVGREGWMFLGDKYEGVLSKSRGYKVVDDKFAERWAGNIKSNQIWIEKEGAKVVMVVAPNKHSVYGEYAPSWIELTPNKNTDKLLLHARQQSLMHIDLRPYVIEGKKSGRYIYNRAGTHWNSGGASIAYSAMINQIGKMFDIDLHRADTAFNGESDSRDRGLLGMLKVNDFVDAGYDKEYEYLETRQDQDIEFCNLGEGIVNFDYTCQKSGNREVTIHDLPTMIKNKNALNRMKVLWLRDSYGTALSLLMHRTFSTVWEYHFNKLYGMQLKDFISTHSPDLVVYEVVERLLEERGVYTRFPPLRRLDNDEASIELGRSSIIFDVKDDVSSLHTSNVRLTSTDWGLKAETIGASNDPVIELPVYDMESDQDCIIDIELESPTETSLQLYYVIPEEGENNFHRPENSVTVPIHKGNNRLVYSLPGYLLQHPLRVDIASDAGAYSIKALDLYRMNKAGR